MTGRGTEDRFEIEAPETDYERATAITGGAEFEIAEDRHESMKANTGEDDVVLPESERKIGPQFWYPEDATSLAWEGEPAEAREMIELSMQENDIRTRFEIEDGKPRLYVLPEDEERAKEIVKEILEGQPPE